MFTFGIEHEVAFLNRAGHFVSFGSTSFTEFGKIIVDLPLYAGDYPQPILEQRVTPAHRMISIFQATGSIEATLRFLQSIRRQMASAYAY